MRHVRGSNKQEKNRLMMKASAKQPLKEKYPPLNISEVAEGMFACRSNACELIKESDILSTAGHFARAYALLHTACEELAKFSILELGGRRVFIGNPPIWKRFWQRFRSHDSKIAQLNVQLILLMLESGEAADPDLLKSAETLFGGGLVIRNAALYADLGPGESFRSPSDIDFSIPIPILHKISELALAAADRRGVFGPRC